MALNNLLKRRSIGGNYYWTLPYQPSVKGELQELGLDFKRKSAFVPQLKRNTWVYALFPAKGDLRSRGKVEEFLEFEEEVDQTIGVEAAGVLQTPPQELFKEMPNLLSQAFEEKNAQATIKLQKIMNLVEVGDIEEAFNLYNEVKKELSEERTFVFNMELRDEWQT